MRFGQQFFEVYGAMFAEPRILDVGAYDVNGSLRTVAPKAGSYLGVDFAEGPGVDQVMTDPYALPFADESFDLCVSTSVLEHAEFFWLSFLEMIRVVVPGGLVYVNAPSNGEFHRYASDYWRFYPDAGFAMERWAKRNGVSVALLESFIGKQDGDQWNDFVAVFVKDEATVDRFGGRIMDLNPNYYNGFSRGDPSIRNPSVFQEDQHEAGAKKARQQRKRTQASRSDHLLTW